MIRLEGSVARARKQFRGRRSHKAEGASESEVRKIYVLSLTNTPFSILKLNEISIIVIANWGGDT